MSSKPDKATTERNSRTLRELVRRPDNKVCADCKKNDPRWASWNLGVFLCIRCSGIHRSMGTHISKVKSIDLDVWTAEQMGSIQKWGNRLANLYWEAHLNSGHIPPEHKMESFIRSKYESRRWAKDGPPPSNPAVLDQENGTPVQSVSPPPQTPSPPPARATNRQSQPHKLLSVTAQSQPPPSAPAPVQSQQPPVAAAQPPPLPNADLFTLDFHQPAQPQPQATQMEAPKNVKQDILSLFSKPSPAASQAQVSFGQYAQPSPWGAAPQPPQQQQQPQSMMGTQGVGMWGANSGWNAPIQQDNLWAQQQTQAPAAQPWGTQAPTAQPWGAQAPTAQSWGAPQQQQPQQPNLFASGNDIWGGSSNLSTAQKKDDLFGDIWK